MFGMLKHMFGIHVEEDETEDRITIWGINTKDLFRDVSKVWKTKR